VPPEESEDATSESIAFFAYTAYKETGQFVFDKFGEDFTPREEIFALMAAITDTAVICEIPVDFLIKNLKMMHLAKTAAMQVKSEGDANGTTD
jgi:hypothetical protein